MTPSKRRILAPKKLSSQTCANYFLILETLFSCVLWIWNKVWFDAVREGVPGASGQFDLKASQVQSLLTDKPQLLCLDCDHLMSHHIALQSVLGKRESKAGTLFPQFSALSPACSFALYSLLSWTQFAFAQLSQSFPFYRTQVNLRSDLWVWMSLQEVCES